MRRSYPSELGSILMYMEIYTDSSTKTIKHSIIDNFNSIQLILGQLLINILLIECKHSDL